MATHISDEVRQKVVQRAQRRCEYCQSPQLLTGLPFTLDHIIPRQAGGSDNLDNLCLACSACNSHKHIRTTATDPESGMTVPLFHPRRQRWQDHFEWSKDGEQVIGRTAVGRSTIIALQLNRELVVNARRLWVSAGWHPPSE